MSSDEARNDRAVEKHDAQVEAANQACPVCNGTGLIVWAQACWACDGEGVAW